MAKRVLMVLTAHDQIGLSGKKLVTGLMKLQRQIIH